MTRWWTQQCGPFQLAEPTSAEMAYNPSIGYEALQRRASGEPLIEIARTFGVSHSTISRLAEA
jgi:hypothetical protein